MVGLGENKEEIIQVMDDLRTAEVDFLTIGQYLQPSEKHHPLHRYYHPNEFKELAKDLTQKKTTIEVRLRGDTVLKLGEKANPKLAKIITLSSNIEITDLRKLKKLSDEF